MSIENLTPSQLRLAADLKEKIAGLEKQLAALGNKTKAVPVIVPKTVKPAKRKISAAHIAKIRAAQKLRWAKVNAGKAKPSVVKAVVKAKPVVKKKGGLSAAGKARIVAAQKARWAKIKAAKPATTTPVPKPAVAVKAVVKPAASKSVIKAKSAAKKKISAEGIARIKAAQKARWAKIKAAKK